MTTDVKQVRPVGRAVARRKEAGGLAKMTDRQVRAAHTLYVHAGLSLNDLARLLWNQFGYASEKSCSSCLHRRFVKDGLPTRPQREATAARNRTHGMTAKDPTGYARWLRRRGSTARPCGAETTRGGTCSRLVDAGRSCPFHPVIERLDELAKRNGHRNGTS